MIETLFLILFAIVCFYYLFIVLGFVLGLVLVGLLIALNLLSWTLRCVRGLISWLFMQANIQIPTIKELEAKNVPKLPYTPKEKLELTVGCIAIGYTLVLIAIAAFTAMPLDVTVCIWLIFNAVLSVIANKKMKKIKKMDDKTV